MNRALCAAAVCLTAGAASANVTESHHGAGGLVSDSTGDPMVTQFNISVSNHAILKDVEQVMLQQFRYTFAGDLGITLTHVETGTSVVLLDRPGVPETEFGDSAQFVFPTYTWQDGGFVYDADVFDSFVTTTILGPVSGNLSDFAGEDTFGTWTLELIDYRAGGVGVLGGGWDIVFSTAPAPGALAALGCGGLLLRRRHRR